MFLSLREKVKLTFLRLFDNPLSKYLILKKICHAVAVLGVLPKP